MQYVALKNKQVSIHKLIGHVKGHRSQIKGSAIGQNRAILKTKIMMAIHYNILNEKESMC